MMKITYDKEADAMYIKLKGSRVAKTKEVDETTIVDLDDKGNIIGIELLFVKERMPHAVKRIKIENLLIAH